MPGRAQGKIHSEGSEDTVIQMDEIRQQLSGTLQTLKEAGESL